MRNLPIAFALATTILASPAVARDNSFYVGLEGGLMKIDDTELDYSDALVTINDAYQLDHKTGWDVDLIAGYDFGMIRAEAEIGYKRANIGDINVHPAILVAPVGATFDADGHSSAWSVMLNALLDFGDDNGISGYIGGGVGAARVKQRFDIDAIGRSFNGSRGRIALQGIAGVRMAVSENVDVGLKYRYFHIGNVDFDADGPSGPFEVESRWRSHSLLLSLIYNFAPPPPRPLPPPPAPPPPPPPPATQTCPDGTVILATEVCPAPPPPPPPPPPAPERG